MEQTELEKKIAEMLDSRVTVNQNGVEYIHRTKLGELTADIKQLIQQREEAKVRDAYRKGYFDSGVLPTESEVEKFESCYREFIKSLSSKES